MATAFNGIENQLNWATIDTFSKRSRSLEIVIENRTVQPLKLEEDYIASGERINTTFNRVIAPKSSWLTLVANKTLCIGPAVGGGLKYRLAGKENILYLGFCNPFRGDPVSFVFLSNVEHTANWAYDEANDGTFKSSQFEQRRLTAEIINATYSPSKRIVFRLE